MEVYMTTGQISRDEMHGALEDKLCSYFGVTGKEATDEQVVITLTEPNAAFLAELGCFNMVLGDQSSAASISEEE